MNQPSDRMPSERMLFDRGHIRRAFARAARGYDAAASLQHAVEAHLLESLDYFEQRQPARTPQVVLDLGSGPGRAAATMQQRWPKARVLALDLALPMLREAKRRQGWRARGWQSLRRSVHPVCADARALPLADNCVDVLFSNLCLQWVEDLPAVFAGFRRVLKPGGLLLVSTFGAETLHELRAAFAAADTAPHVSPFTGIAPFGDALMSAGFRDPVLDRELTTNRYPDLAALMRELRTIGATNALHARRHTLTGKARFARAAAAYAIHADTDGALPATWETITAMAWAPPAGAPIRDGGGEVARFPADAIPVRRR